jgi:hypothetical protein
MGEALITTDTQQLFCRARVVLPEARLRPGFGANHQSGAVGRKSTRTVSRMGRLGNKPSLPLVFFFV